MHTLLYFATYMYIRYRGNASERLSLFGYTPSGAKHGNFGDPQLGDTDSKSIPANEVRSY